MSLPRNIMIYSSPSLTFPRNHQKSWKSCSIHVSKACSPTCFGLHVPVSYCVARGSRFTLGVWGLRVCSLDVASASATVRNRSQPSATVRAIPVWPCLWEVLQRWSFLDVSDVSLLRFAWQVWHFVAFRRVLQRVESRFAWQAQYFCDVFRRCVAVFVAGAALWTCPSFFVAGAAL